MNPGRTVTVENLLLAALDARDADGKPFASPEELANPTEFVLLNQVVAPLLREFAPTDKFGVAGVLSALAGGGAGAAGVGAPAGAAPADLTSGLARQVEELKAAVADQGRIIDELRKSSR
jgi:hypothetical protein